MRKHDLEGCTAGRLRAKPAPSALRDRKQEPVKLHDRRAGGLEEAQGGFRIALQRAPEGGHGDVRRAIRPGREGLRSGMDVRYGPSRLQKEHDAVRVDGDAVMGDTVADERGRKGKRPDSNNR